LLNIVDTGPAAAYNCVEMRNEVRIHYETEGDGTPLVLLHGALVGSEMWHELGYVDALRDDHRLILIDARGHGQSEAPRDPAQYRPELMAGDVTAVLDALEIPAAHFLGASMGAAIGFQLARRAPQRCTSLVLLGYGRCGEPTAAEQQFNAAGRRMYETAAAVGGAALLAGMGPAATALSPATRAAFLANDWPAQLAFYSAFETWPGFEQDLPGMALPCLLVAAESDAFHTAAARCAARMPQASFVTLPGGVHGQESYRPERVLPHARAFWESLGAR
jgi:pimeloyl-ACP methyl ester carboxylesterase